MIQESFFLKKNKKKKPQYLYNLGTCIIFDPHEHLLKVTYNPIHYRIIKKCFFSCDQLTNYNNNNTYTYNT